MREFPIKGAGYAYYLLFVDRKAVGAIEAKKEGMTLGAVSEQTLKYLKHFPEEIPHHQRPLPFSYESTGVVGRQRQQLWLFLGKYLGHGLKCRG